MPRIVVYVDHGVVQEVSCSTKVSSIQVIDFDDLREFGMKHSDKLNRLETATKNLISIFQDVEEGVEGNELASAVIGKIEAA